MKIIKEPNLSLACPVCGCEFEFDKNDVYNATGGTRKGIPKNPHKAVRCPVCDKSIPIWGNKVSKDNKHDDNPYNEYSYNSGLCYEDGSPCWGLDIKYCLYELKHGRNPYEFRIK